MLRSQSYIYLVVGPSYVACEPARTLRRPRLPNSPASSRACWRRLGEAHRGCGFLFEPAVHSDVNSRRLPHRPLSVIIPATRPAMTVTCRFKEPFLRFWPSDACNHLFRDNKSRRSRREFDSRSLSMCIPVIFGDAFVFRFRCRCQKLKSRSGYIHPARSQIRASIFGSPSFQLRAISSGLNESKYTISAAA